MSTAKKTGTSTELQQIAADLRRMYEGGAWHGPSLQEALDGVTTGMAGARPIANAHTIFELAHHVAAWIGEVTRRLDGGGPGAPVDGDFPSSSVRVDDTIWADVKARLAQRHVELERAILSFDSARLDDVVGGERDAPLGTGMTYRATLYGVIEHDAYHAGQIVLLRRALG